MRPVSSPWIMLSTTLAMEGALDKVRIPTKANLKVASMDSIAFFRSSSKRANNCLRLTSSFSLFSLMRPSASARAFSL